MENMTTNVTLYDATKGKGTLPSVSQGLKTKTTYKIRIMSEKGI